MKTTIIILSIFLFTNSSCGKKTSDIIQEPGVSTKKVAIAEIEAKMDMPDCLEEYGDIERVINGEGKIVTVMDMLMISYKSSSRLNPCNVPEGFSEGDEITFSGVIKEAPKGVRLAGTPFKLTSIVRK